jgi:WD40 repeat protein
MVEDARKTSDPLAELSCVLHELYAEYAADREITAAEYDEARGYHSAIAKRADDAMDQVVRMIPEPETVGQRMVLDTWLNFVNVAGPVRTARRVRYSDLGIREQAIVDSFVRDSQLLTLNEDDGERTVEVRQEVVLRSWPRLVACIDENADVLNMRTDLERLASAWHDSGRQDQHLLRPERARRSAQHVLLRGGLVGEFLRASSDTDDTVAIANAAAREALDIVERDPEQAIRIAESAAALKPTTAARFGLYRTWASGLRVALRYPAGMPTSVAWSPDGRLAMGYDDGSLRVRAPGGRVQVLDGHRSAVRCLAWSFDRRLASGSDDRTVRIWDADGAWTDELTDHEGAVTSVAWAPDGRLATGCEDHNVRIWSRDRVLRFVLREHEGPVRSVAWSHDGSRLASGSDDRSVRVWTEDWQVSTHRGNQGGPVRCVAWSPDGSLASGSDDRRVRIVTAQGRVHLLPRHSGPVLSLAWSADGRLVSGCADKTVRVWGGLKHVLYRLNGHGGPVVSLAWSPDGKIASAAHDTVRVFSPQKEVLQTLTDHEGSVVSLAWSPDGRLAAGSTDKVVRVWADDGQLKHSHTYRKDRVAPLLAWAPNGVLAFAAGHTDPRLRLLARDGSETEITPNSGNAVACVAWRQLAGRPTSDAKGTMLAIGSNNGLVRVSDGNGRKVRELGTRSGAVVRSVAWSSDGRLAAGSDDATVRLWSPDWVEQTLPKHDGPVRSVAFSTDGRLASASDDKSVRIWSTDGELLATLNGHKGPVCSVAWSVDGWLATGSADTFARLWTPDGELMYELSGHEGPVRAVAWSPDGRLASGSDDRTVRLWPCPAMVVDLQELVKGAQELRPVPNDRLRALLLPTALDGEPRSALV